MHGSARSTSAARLVDGRDGDSARGGAARRSGHRRLLVAISMLVAALLCALTAPAALAGTANAGLAGAPGSDPIAGMTWGIYTGGDDGVYPAYEKARGETRTLLAEVAQRPEAYWFGQSWKNANGAISQYIQATTHGNNNVLAQISDFSMAPWEGTICSNGGNGPTPAQVSAFRAWNDGALAAAGNHRLLVVMQPDLPEIHSGCITARGRATFNSLISWATQQFSALKHTTVYLDAGSSDWLSPAEDAQVLIAAGVRHARGFSLDATHYASTTQEIYYGAKVIRALAARGVRGKHFIVDTAENGNPFTHQQYTKAGFNTRKWASRPACVKHRHVRFCQTFGIPPTWQVGLAQWHLGAAARLAKKDVDGYIWFGRPWLKGQTWPFDPSLVEAMARSTPFPFPKYRTPSA